ncbi:MAG TPA: DMT family transporter [Pirellulales bacterium]|jgi:drug/metabolite transporter (DMT)-like permease
MPDDGPPPPADRKARGWWFLLLLTAASLMWSAQGTAVKFLAPADSAGHQPAAGPTHLGPIAITFLPFYVATLLLLPLLLRLRRRDKKTSWPSAADWGRFAIAGIAGQVLAQLGMTWGVIASLASNAAVLNLLIPVISAVLASALLGERLTRLRVLCLLIGLAGVMLMSIKDFEESALLERSFLVGNALILVGCFGSSFYNVYCKGLMARFHEVEILIYSYITASFASLPVLLWLEPDAWSALLKLDTRGWAAFAFLAVFMYTVSMLLFFYVLEHIPVTVASAALYLVPLFGVVIASVLLGERMSPLALAGAGVVLTATVLIMRYDSSV